MESLKQRVARGAVWLGAGRLLINLIGFASTILLARFLTPADFGLVAIATSLLAVVMSLTELSMSSALVHHRDPTLDHFHSAWTIALIRSAIVALLFCAAAYPISLLYNDPRLLELVIVVGLTGAAAGMLNPRAIIRAKQLIFWPEFVLSVSQRLVTSLVAIPVAFYFHTYWSIVMATAAGTLVMVALSYAIVPYLPRLKLTHFKELFNFSIWLALGQAINTLNWRLDQFLIGYYIGKPQLGVYAVADNLSALPTRESTAPLSQTLFPGFVKVADEPGRLSRAYLLAQSTLCAVALPCGFGFAAAAHPIVLLTIGEKWVSAIPIIQVLSGTFALQTLSSALQPLAMATGNTKSLFRRDVRNLLIRVPFILAGLWAGGLIGIVYARAISSFVGTVLNMALVRKLVGLTLRRQFAANSRALISVCVLLGISALVGQAIGEVAGHGPLASKAAAILVIGGFGYFASMATIWRISGRPEGPESEILRLFKKRLGRART